MSKCNTFEADVLKLVFQALPIANIADNAASGALSALYISLHTASPTDSPNSQQSQSEVAYTNYARVGVLRNGSNWQVVTDGGGTTEASNLLEVLFPQCGATGATATHFGVGTLASGSGKLLYHGALNSPLAISTGITPRFAPGALKVRED